MKLAVFGSPIAHSRSPQIHEAFAAQHGRQIEYARILAEPESFPVIFARFQVASGVGANVTVPLKELALQLCDQLSPRAEQAGAVNTLIKQGERWLGHNTDGDGLVADLLRHGLKLQRARVLLVGAGGAIRGVLGPFVDAGCKHIHIVNRTANKATALAREWQTRLTANAGAAELAATFTPSITGGGLLTAAGEWDIIINGTSSGLSNQRPELPAGALQQRPFCYDMVYGNQLPPFLNWAQAHNCAIADGLGMLVEQAALSYFQWTGDVPNTQAVLDSMRSNLTRGE